MQTNQDATVTTSLTVSLESELSVLLTDVTYLVQDLVVVVIDVLDIVLNLLASVLSILSDVLYELEITLTLVLDEVAYSKPTQLARLLSTSISPESDHHL